VREYSRGTAAAKRSSSATSTWPGVCPCLKNRLYRRASASAEFTGNVSYDRPPGCEISYVHPPTDFELQAMRGDKPRENFMLMAHALRDLASGVTNTDYWDFNAGASMDGPMMDKMEKALASGIDLPARLSTPGQDGGHFIMFTDVRNQEGQREFLASDPWSGRSTWLKESDLGNPKSDWPRREFNVFWQQVTDVFAPIDFVKPDGQ